MWKRVDAMMDTDFLRSITVEDLALLGAEEIVYVKPVTVDSKLAFAVNTADGRQMAVVRDFETAVASAIQNKFVPFSVH